ncbi:helix-turn-helix domain-containing protein [Aliarcobacter butzleri]|uniref:helix-turn-helix domain-containing protein n=1 Tax=Aliarcobacter butzleri TaxID=28197 RepID=UPI0021B2CC5B|nr:helix-turn-helix transcriptional regulator [Aliarcobacter butzleri]MCT7611503.1 helix-turn-helix domain-containing protein [Aliarcobacter butzleri]
MAKNVKISPKPNSNVILDIKDFGKHLKYKRTSQGLTLVEASQLCNINATTLIRLEKGSDGVRLLTALYVAKMFGLKLTLE